MHPAVEAIRHARTAVLRDLLRDDQGLARKPQLVLEAARCAAAEALVLLLDAGADPNACWRGYRPLHALLQEKPPGEAIGATPRRLACLDLLLARGADPEQLGAWPPARAVVIAAFAGEPDFVARLLGAGAMRDGFIAAALGDQTLLRRALGADPALATARDREHLTALQCSAGSRLWQGQPKLARRLLASATLLLDAGADPGATTESWSHAVDAAYLACAARHAAMLELLLERGADATAALSSAVWTDLTLADRTLAHGADPDRATDGERPLLNELIRWGQVKPALWLLGKGASPNVADARGWTAVHQAASRGNARLLQAVLAAGGDTLRPDRQGLTAEDVAGVARKARAIRLLLRGAGGRRHEG